MVKKQPLHREAVKKNECFLSTPGDAADTRFHRRGRWGRKGVGCKERQMGEERKNDCFLLTPGDTPRQMGEERSGL